MVIAIIINFIIVVSDTVFKIIIAIIKAAIIIRFELLHQENNSIDTLIDFNFIKSTFDFINMHFDIKVIIIVPFIGLETSYYY